MDRARSPLVPPALAFAAGISLAPWTPVGAAWVALVAGLVWAVSLVVLERSGPATVALLIGIAAAGALRATPLPPAPDHVARLPLPLRANLAGRLLAEPLRFAPGRTRLVLEVERVDGRRRSGHARITAYGANLAALVEGQRVEMRASLHRVDGFRNPGGLDQADRLQRQGFLVVGSARAEDVRPVDAPGPPWPARVRRAARAAMLRTLPSASAALLGGLLLGDRSNLPRDIDEAFRRAGVYHVLAVSGFNVALVAGAVWSLLTLAGAGQRGAASGALIAVVGFALVVGPEPSVLRAMVMALVLLGARLLDREASVVNSLALAALLLLAARPADLHDPGFQLSFAATAGIVLAPLPRGPLLGSLGVSFAAQLAVLPVGLTHFNQISLVGPLANLAVVPLAGVATILGLLAVAAAPAGAALAPAAVFSDVLFNALWPVLLALRGAVALAARAPAALVHLPAPHWTATVAYTIALGFGLRAWRLRGEASAGARRAAVASAVLLAAAVAIAAWPLVRPLDGTLRITVLDVGQGDAIVIEAPDGRALLVDAGPGGPARLDTGERVVAPFLWNRGILRLAATITTHADGDHAGGMAAIRRWFSVAERWDPHTMPHERQWIGAMSLLRLGDLGAAEALHPNDTAVVLRLDYGLASFLLASDATADVERALVTARAPLAATVLKVAHHGSRGSSTPEFLDRVAPLLAVVSVGRRNAYGHPAPEALERLAAAGARILRTDRDGALILETDGRTLRVTRWAARAVERYCLDPEGFC